MRDLKGLACFLACVGLTSIATAQQDTPAKKKDAASYVPVWTQPAAGTGSYLALGDQLGTVDVSTVTGDNDMYGVAAAYGYFYVSGSNNSATPIGNLYQFNPAGLLLGTFPQNQTTATPVSSFGHRDLASDGEGIDFNQNPGGGRLWGGQEGGNWVRYDLSASGAPNAGTPLPKIPNVGTMRGLTWLPQGTPVERFVCFQTTFLTEFNEAGTNFGNVNLGTGGDRYQGLATDPTNPDLVWGLSFVTATCIAGNPGTNSELHFYQLDRTLNYMKTGLEFCGGNNTASTAGGLSIFDGTSAGINAGSFTFAALQRAGTPIADAIGLYDSGISTGASSAFCTAKTTSVCGPASLTASGTSSATQTEGFVLSFSPTRGCRSGLILYTRFLAASAAPFGGPGDGMLCLEPMGLRRAGPIDSGGTSPAFCDGVMAMDFNEFSHAMHSANGCAPPLGQNNPAGFLLNPGTTVHAQGWGRDSVMSGQVLSDGRTWTVGP